MRIISGKYKGKRFDVRHTFKARPTTDFAKESLFNILCNNYVDFDESPTALDLFAGTGSISLELLSRGCSRVVSVEKDFKHWLYLVKTCRELCDKGWKPLHADVFRVLGQTSYLQHLLSKGKEECVSDDAEVNVDEDNSGVASSCGFNIIFADPPYALENLGDLPDLVLDSGLLLNGEDGRTASVFILEHGRNYDFSQHPRFIEHRNYGSVNFSFFR